MSSIPSFNMDPQSKPGDQFPLRCSLCYKLTSQLELNLKADRNDDESLGEPPGQLWSAQENELVMDLGTPSLPKMDTEEIKG